MTQNTTSFDGIRAFLKRANPTVQDAKECLEHAEWFQHSKAREWMPAEHRARYDFLHEQGRKKSLEILNAKNDET